MELRVLKYFLMIAREENITRAAQLLHVTQPTLSRQIKELEEELGTKLFERSNHRIILTQDGLLLRRRAQEIMELQQDISLQKNQEKVGKILKVLIDRKEAGRYIGRTEFDSVEVDNEVIINSPGKLKIGAFVQVNITKAFDYDLEGDIVYSS